MLEFDERCFESGQCPMAYRACCPGSAVCEAGKASCDLYIELYCHGTVCEFDWVCGAGAGEEDEEGVWCHYGDYAGECGGDCAVHGVVDEVCTNRP